MEEFPIRTPSSAESSSQQQQQPQIVTLGEDFSSESTKNPETCGPTTGNHLTTGNVTSLERTTRPLPSFMFIYKPPLSRIDSLLLLFLAAAAASHSTVTSLLNVKWLTF